MMVSLKNILRVTMVLCGVVFVYGCTDEDIIPNNRDSRLITFTAEDNWTDDVVAAKTRSQRTAQHDICPLVSEDSTLTLYLHTTITDNTGVGKTSNGAATRAIPMESVDDMESFQVYGYRYTHSTDNKGNDVYTAAGTDPFVDDVISRTGTGASAVWQGAKTYYWPGADHWFRFFAYAPSDIKNLTLTYPQTVFHYEVPDKAANQADLMFANTESVVEGNKYIQGDYANGALPLTFRHIMTGIRFKKGTIGFGGTIKSITFRNVYNIGVFDLAQADNTEWEWTLTGETGDYTQTVNFQLGNNVDDIISGDNTFMMLPQLLPYNAMIEVDYCPDNEGGDEHEHITLRANIGGTSWSMGKIVTYTIDASGVFFDIEATEAVVFDNKELASDPITYTVTSRNIVNGVLSDVDWTCDFYKLVDRVNNTYQKIEKPDWLTFNATDVVNTGTDTDKQYYKNGATYTISVAGRTPENVNAWLKTTSPKGVANKPYNLSNKKSVESTDETDKTKTTVDNTANCYIVSTPGYYTLPLVYGNAIKGGDDNTSAYKTGGVEDKNNNILENFVNHAKEQITSPWIQDMVTAPKSAGLIWQDAPDLVTVTSGLQQRDVTYGSASKEDVYFLDFNIAATDIQQGNAVVAVYDGDYVDGQPTGNILWSWHIWVTDWNLDDDRNAGDELMSSTSIITKRKHTIMSNNLGWCDGNAEVYPGSEVIIRFYQRDRSEDFKDVTVRRKKLTVSQSSIGNAPYYQWGRKDPMIPDNGKGGLTQAYNKTYYLGDGTVRSGENVNTIDLGTGWREDYSDGREEAAKCVIRNGIKNPLLFYAGMTMDNRFQNLWGGAKG